MITGADMRTALRTYIIDDTNIRAIISTRVYALRAPQQAVTPYIVFEEVFNIEGATHSGTDELNTNLMQLTMVGPNATQLMALASLLTNRLHAFRGYFDEFGALCDVPCLPGINIHTCFLRDGRSDDSSVADLFAISQDYEITYNITE